MKQLFLLEICKFVWPRYDEGTENSPECIDKWKADIRLELGADDWNEGGKDCTEEPGELKWGPGYIAQRNLENAQDCNEDQAMISSDQQTMTK